MTDWRKQAACLDQDPELFFPIGNTGPAILQAEEAKAVCRRCPVVETCLTWAIDTGQDTGVWGGMAEDERRSLKRRNARAGVRRKPGDPIPPTGRSGVRGGYTDAGEVRRLIAGLHGRGWTYKAIAETVGISHEHASTIARGITLQVTLPVHNRIVKLLGHGSEVSA